MYEWTFSKLKLDIKSWLWLSTSFQYHFHTSIDTGAKTRTYFFFIITDQDSETNSAVNTGIMLSMTVFHERGRRLPFSQKIFMDIDQLFSEELLQIFSRLFEEKKGQLLHSARRKAIKKGLLKTSFLAVPYFSPR